MAGSIRWFLYTADNGAQFAIKLDEGNTETVNGAAAVPPGPTVIAAVPRNIKPRYALYTDVSGLYTRKCYLMTVAAYNLILPSSQFGFPVEGVGAVQMAPSFKRGETVSIPSNIDTGLLDGDNP